MEQRLSVPWNADRDSDDSGMLSPENARCHILGLGFSWVQDLFSELFLALKLFRV